MRLRRVIYIVLALAGLGLVSDALDNQPAAVPAPAPIVQEQHTSPKSLTAPVTTTPIRAVEAPVPKYQTRQVQVAPNGYYTNVDNNQVPRPYYSNTAPSGASAECCDGTYSFSQHRSGTCSHHDGVCTWL